VGAARGGNGRGSGRVAAGGPRPDHEDAEERGFPIDDPVAGSEGEEDEIVSADRAAAEVTRLVERDAEGDLAR
jgi:hypothetical protein